MSEAASRSILGLVPVVGRETLAYLPFRRSVLVSAAFQALYPVVDSVLVVTDDGRADDARAALAHSSTRPQAGASPPADGVGAHVAEVVIEIPSEEARLRAAAGTADVVVIHDPLCPGVSTASLQLLVDAWSPGTVTVAVRPVVDTVKVADDELVAGTLDRDSLRVISSPVIVPADRVAAVQSFGRKLADVAALVAELRMVCEVTLSPMDLLASRVDDVSSLHLLAALDAVRRGVPD